MTAASVLPREQPVGEYEVVATFHDQMPTGVTVSHRGRIFLCYPRWGDPVEYTVAELHDGEARPYPTAEFNRHDEHRRRESLVSVQSVVVDPADRLWLLDTGSVEFGETLPDGPKLVGVDLDQDEVFQTIAFPDDVVLATTYLNDVRFDLRRGEAGLAYITDSSSSGPNGIIVVDLDSGRSWRHLHDHPTTRPVPGFQPIIGGRPASGIGMGSDGIAISEDGQRLYYCPLASRRLYSVSVDALSDPDSPPEAVTGTVDDLGEKGASDGLETDSDGRVYATNYENNAILRRDHDSREWETVVHDATILFPDTLSLARDGHLYFTVNQLYRQPAMNDGQDLRERPYALLRTDVRARPVLLT